MTESKASLTYLFSSVDLQYTALRTFDSTENTWPLLLTTFLHTTVSTAYHLLCGWNVDVKPQVKVEIVLHWLCMSLILSGYYTLFCLESKADSCRSEWVTARHRTAPESTYQCLNVNESSWLLWECRMNTCISACVTVLNTDEEFSRNQGLNSGKACLVLKHWCCSINEKGQN